MQLAFVVWYHDILQHLVVVGIVLVVGQLLEPGGHVDATGLAEQDRIGKVPAEQQQNRPK